MGQNKEVYNSNDEKREAAREKRAASLAVEVLNGAKSRLLLNLPYLSVAVSHIREHDSKVLTGGKDRIFTFGTDGVNLYYDPWYLISRYKEGSDLAAEYLHTLLHCIFRHASCDIRTSLAGNREYWNLACDMAVETIIKETALGDERDLKAAEETEEATLLYEEVLTAIGKPYTAERIYKYVSKHVTEPEKFRMLRRFLMRDEHRLWYESGYGQSNEYEEIEWERIYDEALILADEMEEDASVIDAFGRGKISRITYRDILKKFIRNNERMDTSDEFDYIYYAYGMDLYGNVPLIEPLEYRDDNKPRSLAVAIDTSGSISDEDAAKFVEHTCSMLFEERLLTGKNEIHIIQCDDRVRHDAVVKNIEEATAFSRGFKIYGRGSTDFRPVFTYVNNMINENKLPDFRGLIYYTDGDGIFPSYPPRFDTAFILTSDEAGVPAWSIKYVLEK